MRWLDGITDSMDMSWNKLREMVRHRAAWHACSPRGCKESDTIDQLSNNNRRSSVKPVRSGHVIHSRRLSLPWQRFTETTTGIVKSSHITWIRGTRWMLHIGSWKRE